MKAIEIMATVEKHCIRVPDEIPDGTYLCVLLLVDETTTSPTGDIDLKQLLARATEGLTRKDLRRSRH